MFKDFKGFIATIGNLPSSYVDSMSYYECLMWLCKYVEEAYDKNVVELKEFIDNYLDDLDYQTMVNNKLDEMAQNGTLTNLIKSYIDPIYSDYENRIDTEVSNITNKVDSFENSLDIVEDKVGRLTSYAPKGVYDTVSDLETDNPDHNYIYVVIEDGKWYYYDSSNSQWAVGGTYQASTGYNKALGGINEAFTIISKTGETSYTSSDSKYRINTYEVTAGETYHIQTSIKGSNLPIVCFFDGSNFLSYSGSVTSTTNPADQDVLVTAPSNATKMVVNSYSTKYCRVYGVGDKLNSRYATETFITLGDSRTWYDQQTFGNQTLSEGIICNGYQYYMRNKLGINTYNYGKNGKTTPQICGYILNNTYNFIYNTYNYIVIAGGINDWLNNVTIGSVQDIGSTFNTSTVAGALQSAIEKIITNNPNAKIFLTAPFTGFNNGDEYTRNYSEIRKQVAKKYSIPILDLDDVSRINKVNKDTYYVDDLNDVTYQLHLNNSGYEFISDEICSFINNN